VKKCLAVIVEAVAIVVIAANATRGLVD